MTAPMTHPAALSGEVTVTRDEVAELAHLLGRVEDWLLGCSEFVHADLEVFLPPADGPGRSATSSTRSATPAST